MSIRTKSEKTKAATLVIDSEFREEDGWIFRERPGIPVECVRRADSRLEMTPPSQNRHNFPSA